MTHDLGTIPQSLALAEASPTSLQELLDEDPETRTEGNLTRLIEAMRALRAKYVSGQATATKSKARSSGGSVLVKPMVSSEDLGF
jgi:hypothetical protein